MKLICVSDTHRKHKKVNIPEGDVLVHAGDIGCEHGSNQLKQFARWLKTVPCKHKVIIAGNHDFYIASNLKKTKSILEAIPGCHYLQDSAVTIDKVKFYGSPWQPRFYNWAFNLQRGKQLASVWSLIPDDTDVLITHGPPEGVLDYVRNEHVGCADLFNAVMKVKPTAHVFGHIHCGYGQIDGETTFVNASICTEEYEPLNLPIIVEV